MKKIIFYILLFFLGFLFATIYFKKEVKQQEKEQIQVMLHEIKNVSKLVVAETEISEIYNYQTAKNYFYFPFDFSKKAIIVANAKVKIAYDLSKMELELDSINKKIIINSIPKEEIIIEPNLKYYDLEQSMFNTFTKNELNKINQKAIEQLRKTIEISDLKQRANKQLIAELQKLYFITNVLNWEIVDKTQNQIFSNHFKD
jgi:hypothetical protein